MAARARPGERRRADGGTTVVTANPSEAPAGPAETPTLGQMTDYLRDAWERGVLFQDTLRQRAEDMLEHERQGMPPPLDFDHELLLDARRFERPANYALLRVTRVAEACLEDCLDPAKPPVVIVDPRAGHGPGIGGFKRASEVGMALEEGHPVYFAAFFPQPCRGQTLADVLAALRCFVEAVAARHPGKPPVLYGNCQAGWAVALLSAHCEGLLAPAVLNGSPLSYWAGEAGINPMRLFAGFTGRDNSLTGDFIVTDGVLQTDNARLANEAASLLGQGTADIGNWTMDMLAEIYRQQTDDVPFMALDLTGPLGGPKVALREGAGVTPEGVTPTGQGLVEQFLPGAGTGEGTTEDGIGGLIQDIIPGGEDVPPAGEVIDPNAPGGEGLSTVAPDETTETGAEPATEAIEEEIVPEAEPGAETDAVEPIVDEQPAEEPAVEEQPSADVEPGAEGLSTEPTAEPELAPAEEPAVEEPAVEEQPAAEEPVIEEQPAAEEPAAEEAPGASGLTTEPTEPAAEEVPAEEPAAEESPGASGTTEPAAEPSAEPAAPGSEGVEPGAEPVPETQSQDGTGEDPAQQLLQGILGTDQQ